MHVTDLRLETTPDSRSAAADVVWEDADRPPRTVRFAIPADGHGELRLNPEAFLLGVVVPAMHHGERRVRIDGDVCGTLLENVARALALLHRWYPDDTGHGPPEIECGIRRLPRAAVPEDHRALFVSGGVDSLGVLACERPGSGAARPVRTGIFVHGFDIGGEVQRGPRREFFDAYAERLRQALATSGIGLVPVHSNVKLLDDDWHLWGRQFHGAALAAVAHALAPRFSDVGIAATYASGPVTRWGTHTDLDPLYSGADLRFVHLDADRTRADRTADVAAWPEALAVLRVCTRPEVSSSEHPNCGACIKCVRTMAVLESHDALHRAPTFAFDRVTPEQIVAARIRDPGDAVLAEQVVGPLRERGRGDLAAAFEAAIADFHAWLPWKDAPPPPRWRRAARALDERLLGGRLAQAIRRRRAAPAAAPPTRAAR